MKILPCAFNRITNMNKPFILHQTWISYNDVIGIEQDWQSISPDLIYNFADDEQIKKYIKANFSNRIYSCYMRLLCGAAKADFYRYCVLYNEGGIYSDIDIKPIVPLEQYIYYSPVVVVDDQYGLYNAFIATEPKHQLFKKCIEQVCQNIEQGVNNGGDGLAVTRLCGPRMFANVFERHFNTNYLRTRHEPDYVILHHDIQNQIISYNNEPLLRTQRIYECQQRQYDSGEHYTSGMRLYK